MKKLLLMSAVAMTASTAMAQLPEATAFTDGVDVTPAAYRFYEYEGELQDIVAGGAADWNLDNFWVRDNVFADGAKYEFGDGLFVANGPAFNSQKKKVADLNIACQVVDFGGTLGKCYVINGANSTLDEKLAKLGVDVELEKYPASVGEQWQLYMLTDFPTFENMIQAGHNKYRVRMTLNAYYGGDINGEYSYDEATDTEVTVVAPAGNVFENIYTNDDQGNVKGGLGSIARPLTYDTFVYTNREKGKKDDDKLYVNGNSNYEWNPYRFLVFEWDATDVNIDENNGVNPCRIKAGIAASILNKDAALIIRSVEYFTNDGDELYVQDGALGQTKMTYSYYTIGNSSIDDPVDLGDGAENNPDGIADVTISNVENGRIYNLQGIEVTNANVPGIYIQNGKKFVVK